MRSIVTLALVITQLLVLPPLASPQPSATGKGIGCHDGSGRLEPCRETPLSPPPEDPEKQLRLQEEKRQQKAEEGMHEANDEGLAYARKGDFKAAIEAFKRALEHSPGDPVILKNLATIRERQNKAERRQAAATNVERLKAQMANDIAAIKRLGFEKRAEDFEEWENLSKSARDEFTAQILDSTLAATLHGVKVGTRRVGSLNPPTANRMISRLQEAGVGDPHLFEAIRQVAATSGKPEMATAVNRFVERSVMVKDVMLTTPPVTRADRLEILATVLSWTVKDPVLEFLVADVKFATYALYNNLARRISSQQVEQLTRLTEQQLEILKRLTVKVRDEGKELVAAKKVLAELER